MKIGDAAAALGLAPSALRYYEDQGLVEPLRSAKGTRLYGTGHVNRLAVVQALAGLGVALERVRALATARPESTTGNQASRTVHGLLGELRRDVEEKRRECDTLLEHIATAADLVARCFDCPTRPTRAACAACPVATELDSSRLFHLIWD